MKAFIVPLGLIIFGILIGGGVGAFLYTPPDPTPEQIAAAEEAAKEKKQEAAEITSEFVRLNNQFIIPIVKEGKVAALVILSLELEVEAGTKDVIFELEPKIRDLFLGILFDYANSGGFDGNFTDGGQLVFLKRTLTKAAKLEVVDTIRKVLISGLDRQDF